MLLYFCAIALDWVIQSVFSDSVPEPTAAAPLARQEPGAAVRVPSFTLENSFEPAKVVPLPQRPVGAIGCLHTLGVAAGRRTDHTAPVLAGAPDNLVRPDLTRHVVAVVQHAVLLQALCNNRLGSIVRLPHSVNLPFLLSQ